ncbi:MAG TPA: GyrI-like domain-containing protein, partial [Actinotalea sp.]|nr:GyrI-like domain-containing protein [Actinotalea sp.]
ARARAAGKAPAEVRLDVLAEGRAMQVLHRGPYAEEGPTIAALHAAIEQAGLELRGAHHEIYLSDPRRVAPERMRTILRQPVA